jgi:ribonuclease P protein subunit RPR2
MKRNRKTQSKERIKIAKERIKRLFNLAKEGYEKNPERTARYIELARKIGKRYNVRLTRKEKRSFCKNCNHLLIPNKTSTSEIDSKKQLVIIKCTNCGNIYRYPYEKV